MAKRLHLLQLKKYSFLIEKMVNCFNGFLQLNRRAPTAFGFEYSYRSTPLKSKGVPTASASAFVC
jgi:hypothetical protein